MRVLLVNLNLVRAGAPSEGLEESLSLAYLAAVARREGHGVEILDGSAQRLAPSRLIRTAVDRSRDVDVVGVSILTQALISEAMAVIGGLRWAGFRGHIVVGGHPPTFLHPEMCRDNGGFDSVVVGEGEQTFAELLRALDGRQDWTRLRGLVAAGSRAVGTPLLKRPLLENLDELPYPARDLLPLFLARSSGPRVASVLRSRGCHGRCAFCETRAFYGVSPGPAWRVRSAANVAGEVEMLVGKYGVEAVSFWDDNFVGPGRRGREAAEELARELIHRGLGIRFALQCRATDVTADLFRLLKEAGLTQVFLGLESIVPRQLDFLGKGVTAEENRRALRIIEGLGLDVTIGMIMFDPDTTIDEFRANLAFLDENLGSWGRLRNKVAQTWNRLKVYAGTPLASSLGEEGRLKGSPYNYDYVFASPAVGRLYAWGEVLRRARLTWRGLRLALPGAGLTKQERDDV